MKDRATLPGLAEALALGQLPVILVRHGRTAENAARVLIGRRDPPLDAEGHAQARRFCARLAGLDLAEVCASPLLRARQTVEALGPVALLDGLIELDHGALEGLAEEALDAERSAWLARWRADPGARPLPGGESLAQGAARARAALERAVAGRAPPCPVVACSHQLVLAGLLCSILDRPLREHRRFLLGNGACAVLGWGAGRWQLHGADRVGQVAGAEESASSRAVSSASSKR